MIKVRKVPKESDMVHHWVYNMSYHIAITQLELGVVNGSHD